MRSDACQYLTVQRCFALDLSVAEIDRFHALIMQEREREREREREFIMKKLIAGAVIAIALAPMDAFAQERTADAALGALSGAVVLGPLGAVAGAVVGYTAGPAIASSWGMRRSGRYYHRHDARTVRHSKSSNERADIPKAPSPEPRSAAGKDG
jgi:hypothetical protein